MLVYRISIRFTSAIFRGPHVQNGASAGTRNCDDLTADSRRLVCQVSQRFDAKTRDPRRPSARSVTTLDHEHVLSLVRQMRDGKDNDSTFGKRMRGTGQFAELIRQRFDIACRRLQLNARDMALATSRFAVPRPGGGQLTLF